MTTTLVDRIGRTLLYEGYVLYPYRASSLKNRNRATFGTLYASGLSSRPDLPTSFHTECIVRGERARVRVSVRFLQMGAPADEAQGPTFDRAVERRMDIPEFSARDVARSVGETAAQGFALDGTSSDGLVGERLGVCVKVSAEPVGGDAHRVGITVENTTPRPLAPSDEEALRCSLVSAHAVLSVRDGEFVSLLEPEAPFEAAAAACENRGVWPVLVGRPGEKRTLLASPIILYDHPKIAEESPGDLFDATEIDEILSLRIRTLTNAERAEVLRTDPRARALLERTENLDEEAMSRLHGALRTFERTDVVRRFESGARVVLKPRPGGDVFDLSLAGERATVLGMEEDAEGRVYYTVTVDADPGKDLGLLGQPGHRFFLQADELEAVS